MDKKIPKVFANKIDSKGNNNSVFYSKDSVDNFDSFDNVPSKNINQKINDIFNSSSYVYKADVEIKTRDGIVHKRIVGRNGTHLITIDNELISLSDILDIRKK